MRLWSTNYPHGVDSGVEFYGTKGMMYLSKRGKVEVLGNRNRPLKVDVEGNRSVSVPEHMRNWIDCIKSGKAPNAEIEIGHRSASLVHLANISTRVNGTLHFDPDKEKITNNDTANAMLRRNYREGHWATPKGV